MHILVVGLNHKTAPVELRERVALSDASLESALGELREARTVVESVVLSTCNRTEIYAFVTSERAGEDYLTTLLARHANMSTDELRRYLYQHRGAEAVRHLMRVAAGLDSLVVGETQILGQVRSAFLLALDEGNVGTLFDQLFRSALNLGKRAQSETGINQHPVSVSYAAVQLAKQILGDLRGQRVLMIGAGKMSHLAAQHLRTNGSDELVIVNRTFERAEQLAHTYGARPAPWSSLAAELAKADIVISSTGAREVILTPEVMTQAQRARGHRPLVLVDIAVPRDVDPNVAAVRGVYLYDIDDLEGVVAANLTERERLAEQVETMIQNALFAYSQWLSEQEIVPVIAAIREKGAAIQASVMASLERKLPNLSERDRQLLHKHTMSIVNQLLRDPILNMKTLASLSGGGHSARVFAQLFGIDERALAAQSNRVRLVAASDDESSEQAAQTDLLDLVRQWGQALVEGERARHREPVLHPMLR
ncbi:MAG: glutamyl-tRNA reductase [Alicyclobacillus sp.]|nr:glutamyl-tRNA reductase [Alicyclobacillus sp.]